MNQNMNHTYDYFRRRLCGLFEVTDYRREDLARYLRVPLKTVQAWENGDKIPDVYQFREIANFFDLPYTWFLDGTDDMPDPEELALRLGLSESTVEELVKLSAIAPSQTLDALDDIVFLLVTTAESIIQRKRGSRR